jgi:hypothetical protein
MGEGLSPEAMLAAWEAGSRRAPLDRALLLLWAGGAGEGAADLPLAERDRRLLAMREAAFGRSLDCVAACPGCGARVEVSVDADDLAGALPVPASGAVDIGGQTVALRALTSRDLAAAQGVAPEALPAFLRRRMIPDADETKFEAEVEAAIEAQAEAAEMWLTLTCPDCGTTWRDAFDIAAHLWTEVEVAAMRTMAEVAELARAYGWTERDVLALSPVRRAVYLSLAREGT